MTMSIQDLRREAALAEQVRDKARYLAQVANDHAQWAQQTYVDALARYSAAYQDRPPTGSTS